uniref:(northern house mosquito) hypothetical protein n=1 Tax=Culex pipiens TaxID=7175 RepID=A0A8D8CBP3_CULPI
MLDRHRRSHQLVLKSGTVPAVRTVSLLASFDRFSTAWYGRPLPEVSFSQRDQPRSRLCGLSPSIRFSSDIRLLNRFLKSATIPAARSVFLLPPSGRFSSNPRWSTIAGGILSFSRGA